jgi:MFS family permease
MAQNVTLEPKAAEVAAGGEAVAAPPAKRSFGRAFWMLNGIEMWERLAYFCVRVMAPIYIMQADDPGGLHLTAADKGWIYAWWAVFQSILPMFTGGFADRYGYKKTLAFSISLNTIGYLMMAFLRSYWGFFGGIIVLATGTAFFKPSIQGSLAQNLNKDNSSVGWGVFYWVVNIGGAAGPFVATLLLGTPHTVEAWRNLFLASAGFTCLNFLMLLTFKDVPSGADKRDGPWKVFVRTVTNIFEPRLVAWLAIMSCFWLMMYQLWDLHPNFIQDWVDTSSMAALLAPVSDVFVEPSPTGGMRVPQQILLNINALFIVLFVIPVSWLVRKLRTLACMLIGMGVATCGILVAGLTHSGWILALGIVFFSLGEMLTGPKKNEYLGLIAPPGKKGLYLGYVNIPVGVGTFVGSWLAGQIYGTYGEKANLALKYLAEKTSFGLGKGWDGSMGTLEATLGVTRPEAFAKLQEVTGLDPTAATNLLWDTYSPHLHVWLPFAAIGVVAFVALAVFGQMAKRWKDMNA